MLPAANTFKHRWAALLGVLAAITALLGGCGPRSLPSSSTAVALPLGCGPRPVQEPAATAILASTATPGRSLPIYGAAVGDHSLTAVGGTVVTFAGSGVASPNPLYVSTDTGLHWTHLPKPLPPVNGSLDPLVLSPNGHTLAGSDGQDLYVLGLPAPAGDAVSTWQTQPVQNLTLLAFDPADSNVLAGLGAQTGTGRLLLYGSTNGGHTLTAHPLPATIGHGEALAVMDGTALVAVGQGAGPVRLFGVPLSPGAVATPPQPPVGATSPVFALAAGPSGTLYLATAGGLFTLPHGGRTWTSIPTPSGVAKDASIYVAATAGQLYISADNASDEGVLWRGPKTGGAWQTIKMPSGFIGQPVVDGTQVWVPADAGPVLVGSGDVGVVRAEGIAAPATVVASAAWRPTLVAAGWRGGLFFSADGGQTWNARTPPGSPLRSITQLSWTPDGGCVAVIRAALGKSPPEAYLSGNAGRSWWSLPAPGAGWVTAVTESQPGSGIWWVAESGTTPGLYRSAPGRAVWTKVDLPSAAPAPLHLAPAPGGVWWSGVGFGAWRIRLAPTPRGLARLWTHITDRKPVGPTITEVLGAGADQYDGVTPHALASDPYDPAVVYNGVRRSVDGGATWDLAQPGSAGVAPVTTMVEALAFGPRHPGALLATEFALLRDDGTTWVPVWRTAPDNIITDVAPAGPGRFYVAGQGFGIIVVADPQATWLQPPAPAGQDRWTAPPAGSGAPPLTAAAALAPTTVYRLSPSGTLGVSDDSGKTFPTTYRVALPSGVACCSPADAVGMGSVVASTLAVSPVNAQRLYVGIEIQGLTQGDLGLWTSADGGRTWRRSGLPSDLGVTGLAIAPGTGQTLYVVAYPGLDSGASGLWRSVDGGKTWSRVAGVTGPVFSVGTPTSTEVVAGGAGRVWLSNDGGTTFQPLPLDIPFWAAASGSSTGLPVDAVLQVPGGPLFAATSLGVAQSDDGGRTWQVVSEPVGDPPVQPGGLHLLTDGSVAVATQFGTFTYRDPGRAAP